MQQIQTKVGGLIGNLEKYSKVERSSSLDVTVNGSQDSIGGLVGEINQGIIENSYSTGTVIGKKNFCGGLVGYAKDPEIMNCYTTCTVKGNSNIGGFIGTVRNTGKIENCISIAIMERATDAKFDTGSDKNLIATGFNNNYEIKEFIGRATNASQGCIVGVSYEGNLTTEDFWKQQGDANIGNYGVYFDNTVWNIPTADRLAQGELPTLRGDGNPKGTTVTKPKRPEEVAGDSAASEAQPGIIANEKRKTGVIQTPKVKASKQEEKSKAKATATQKAKATNNAKNTNTTKSKVTKPKANTARKTNKRK